MEKILHFPPQTAIISYLEHHSATSALSTYLNEKNIFGAIAEFFGDQDKYPDGIYPGVTLTISTLNQNLHLPDQAVTYIKTQLTTALRDCAEGKKFQFQKSEVEDVPHSSKDLPSRNEIQKEQQVHPKPKNVDLSAPHFTSVCGKKFSADVTVKDFFAFEPDEEIMKCFISSGSLRVQVSGFENIKLSEYGFSTSDRISSGVHKMERKQDAWHFDD